MTSLSSDTDHRAAGNCHIQNSVLRDIQPVISCNTQFSIHISCSLCCVMKPACLLLSLPRPNPDHCTRHRADYRGQRTCTVCCSASIGCDWHWTRQVKVRDQGRRDTHAPQDTQSKGHRQQRHSRKPHLLDRAAAAAVTAAHFFSRASDTCLAACWSSSYLRLQSSYSGSSSSWNILRTFTVCADKQGDGQGE